MGDDRVSDESVDLGGGVVAPRVELFAAPVRKPVGMADGPGGGEGGAHHPAVVVGREVARIDDEPVAQLGSADAQTAAAGGMGDAEQEGIGRARFRALEPVGNDRGDAAADHDLGLAGCGEIAGAHIGHRFGMLQPRRRHGFAGGIEIAGAEQVILQVAADPGHVDPAVDPRLREHVARAEARAHQQGRGFERPGGEDHLAREDLDRSVRPERLDPADRLALDDQAAGPGSGQDGEVFAGAHCRGEPGVGHRDALAALDIERVGGDADHPAVVVVGKPGQAKRLAGGDEGAGEGADLFLRTVDGQGPAGRAAVVGFVRFEGGQQPLPAPSFIAGRLGPGAEIVRVAAHVAHRVQHARPADHPAPGPVMHPTVGAGLGLGDVIPIVAAPLQGGPGGGGPDIRIGRLLAGLDQQDLAGRVRAQPGGEQRARRAATDDEKVRAGAGTAAGGGHCRAPPALRSAHRCSAGLRRGIELSISGSFPCGLRGRRCQFAVSIAFFAAAMALRTCFLEALRAAVSSRAAIAE